jgi:hypothetical protein
MTRQILQPLKNRIIQLGCIVRVDTDSGINVCVLSRKLNAGPGTFKVATDGYHVRYAANQCALNGFLAVLVILTVVQMGMGID